jgi:hypothetical protein
MLSVTQAVLDRLRLGDQDQALLSLARGLGRALKGKHILIASDHPAWAQALAELNWDGAIQSGTGDSLAVVDANVGFNKANAVTERETAYQVNLRADGSATAHVSLVYRHHGRKAIDTCRITPRYEPVYVDMMNRCYWNYVRIVVPEGATLHTAPRTVVPSEALLRGEDTTSNVSLERLPTGHTAWGQLFLLAPGETITLDFAYELPAGTSVGKPDDRDRIYRLRLPKQPGTDYLRWRVTVRLPEGAQLLSSTPEATGESQTGLTYDLLLGSDGEIAVRYRLGVGL